MDCKYETAETYSVLIACCLSFIGSLGMISVIIIKKLFKSYFFEILFFVSVNDLIRAFSGILWEILDKNNSSCIIYSYIFHTLILSNSVWASCIAWTIYKIVVLEEIDYKKNLKFWLLISYLIPLILGIFPIITNSYANQGLGCDLKTDLIGSIWRFSIFYFLISVNLVGIFILSVKIIKKIKTFNNFSLGWIIIKRGLIYSIIIGICEVPLLTLRITQIFLDECIVILLLIVFLSSLQLQGFYNAVVFIFNKSVREALSMESDISQYNSGFNRSLHISFASTIN